MQETQDNLSLRGRLAFVIGIVASVMIAMIAVLKYGLDNVGDDPLQAVAISVVGLLAAALVAYGTLEVAERLGYKAPPWREWGRSTDAN